MINSVVTTPPLSSSADNVIVLLPMDTGVKAKLVPSNSAVTTVDLLD